MLENIDLNGQTTDRHEGMRWKKAMNFVATNNVFRPRSMSDNVKRAIQASREGKKKRGFAITKRTPPKNGVQFSFGNEDPTKRHILASSGCKKKPKLHLDINEEDINSPKNERFIHPKLSINVLDAPKDQRESEDSIPQVTDIQYDKSLQDGPANLQGNICKEKRVGKGAGGTVYRSFYLPLLKPVAVKEVVVYLEQEKRMIKHELHALHDNLVPIDPDKEEDSNRWKFHQHKNIGSAHPCKYLVSFYGSFMDVGKPTISIVMEFMNGGSIQDLLEKKLPISEPVAKQIAYACLKALDHMHDYRMIHRDIKPANILCNNKGHFKIADFGLAATLSKSKSFFSEFQGTMMYMAPERITGKEYSYSSDIWSTGLVLLSLVLGKFPFSVSEGFFGLEDAIVNEPLPPLPYGYSSSFSTLIYGLLCKNPFNRLSAKEALNLKYFKDIDTPYERSLFLQEWSKFHIAKPPSDQNLNKIAKLLISHERNSRMKNLHQNRDRNSFNMGQVRSALMRCNETNCYNGNQTEIDPFDQRLVCDLAKELSVDSLLLWNCLEKNRRMMYKDSQFELDGDFSANAFGV